MSIPSNLRDEWDKLEKQKRGTPSWWFLRGLVSFLLLQGALRPLINSGEWWSLPTALAIWVGAILVWWFAAIAFESERNRIERKTSEGLSSGWRGVLPMLTVVTSFVLTIRPFAIQPMILSLVLFGAWILVVEQGYAAKRASFDLLDAREQALRAKLAPHFIFNALNTLHAQIDQDPRGAQATTERLAQLFRQVIEASDEATIPLKRELAFVEAYLGIEQARLGNRLRVSIQIPEELEAAQVPPLSLQVLVENAVKHGVAPMERGGDVRIGAERKEGALQVWVEDPGPGFSDHRGTGTALATLRQRLERPEDLVMGLVDGRHRVSFRWRQA